MRIEPPKRNLPTEEDIAYYKKKGQDEGFGLAVFFITVTFVLSAVATASSLLTKRLLKR